MTPYDREQAEAFHNIVVKAVVGTAPDTDAYSQAIKYFESPKAYAFTYRVATTLSPTLFKVGDMARLAQCVQPYVKVFWEELANPLKQKETTPPPYSKATPSTLAN